VLRTRVGYCGGTKENPTYWDLGDHTEAISIDFDPAILSYEDVLQHFWGSHDYQHNIRSTQYRNAVFYRNDEQRSQAESSRYGAAEIAGISIEKVKTPLLRLHQFTYAEGYHQKYALTPHRELRAFLESTYPDIRAFADSAVATRLNANLGTGRGGSASFSSEEVSRFGLPESLESRVLSI